MGAHPPTVSGELSRAFKHSKLLRTLRREENWSTVVPDDRKLEMIDVGRRKRTLVRLTKRGEGMTGCDRVVIEVSMIVSQFTSPVIEILYGGLSEVSSFPLCYAKIGLVILW